jgi:hypothetical protein
VKRIAVGAVMCLALVASWWGRSVYADAPVLSHDTTTVPLVVKGLAPGSSASAHSVIVSALVVNGISPGATASGKTITTTPLVVKGIP